ESVGGVSETRGEWVKRGRPPVLSRFVGVKPLTFCDASPDSVPDCAFGADTALSTIHTDPLCGRARAKRAKRRSFGSRENLEKDTPASLACQKSAGRSSVVVFRRGGEGEASDPLLRGPGVVLFGVGGVDGVEEAFASGRASADRDLPFEDGDRPAPLPQQRAMPAGRLVVPGPDEEAARDEDEPDAGKAVLGSRADAEHARVHQERENSRREGRRALARIGHQPNIPGPPFSETSKCRKPTRMSRNPGALSAVALVQIGFDSWFTGGKLIVNIFGPRASILVTEGHPP